MMVASIVVVAVASTPLFLLWNEWQNARAAEELQDLELHFFE